MMDFTKMNLEPKLIKKLDVSTTYKLFVMDAGLLSKLCFFLAGHKIYLPSGLIALIVLLFVGFFFSMVAAVRRKKSSHRYKKLGHTDVLESDPNPSSAAAPAKKAVTYSVIDGRLVDQ